MTCARWIGRLALCLVPCTTAGGQPPIAAPVALGAPVARLGAAEERTGLRFEVLTEARVATDGALHVYEARSRQVRVFDADGRLRWRTSGARIDESIARFGRFAGNVQLAVHGDTLAALDYTRGFMRLHLFDRHTGQAIGDPARAIVAIDPAPLRDAVFHDFDRFGDRWAIVVQRIDFNRSDGGALRYYPQQEFDVYAIDPALRSLGEPVWRWTGPQPLRDPDEEPAPSPFSAAPRVALVPPQRLVFAHPDSGVMWVNAEHGRDAISLRDWRRDVPNELLERVYRGYRARFGDVFEQTARAYPRPALLPVVGLVRGAPNGALLFTRRDLALTLDRDDQLFFTVLREDGSTRGTFALPPGVFPLDFDGERVLGVRDDRARPLTKNAPDRYGVRYLKELVYFALP
ncbi:MAG: hypothetical protein MUD17_13160 [Gemmatimonadaceae bacterium]|jgi:hypothetical protein|nr:hypothetical protein [Gemmatimonadaceae bacterium]